MKRLLATIVLAACLASPGQAQEAPSPEALRAAQDLTALINGDTIQKISAAMVAQMWPNISARLAGKVDAETLADLRADAERSAAELSSDLMKEAPAIYARNFSAQELRDILAFYKTPTGAKTLRVMPKVMADISATLVPRLPAFQQGMVERMRVILEKHGYK